MSLLAWRKSLDHPIGDCKDKVRLWPASLPCCHSVQCSALLCCTHSISVGNVFPYPLGMGDCIIMQPPATSLPSSLESHPTSRSCKWWSLATIDQFAPQGNFHSLYSVPHSLLFIITAQPSSAQQGSICPSVNGPDETPIHPHSQSRPVVVWPVNRHTAMSHM